MNFDIRAEWAKRSWWMNLIFRLATQLLAYKELINRDKKSSGWKPIQNNRSTNTPCFCIKQCSRVFGVD